MRGWLGALIFVLVQGCVVDGREDEPDVPQPQPGDNALFARLTANAWGRCSQDELGGCESLALRPGGEFAWVVTADIEVLDESGEWKFLGFDEDSGLLLLEGGSVLSFELSDGMLRVGDRDLLAEESQAGDGSREGLAAVASDPEYDLLLAGPWVKANAFDRATVPGRLAFATQQFDADVRGCALRSPWDLEVFDVPGLAGVEPQPRVHALLGANDCLDFVEPGGAAEWIHGDVVVDDERLQISYHTFYRDDAVARPNWFTFGARQDVGIEVSATFEGALADGAATEMEFVITGVGDERPAIERVRVFVRGAESEEIEILDVPVGGPPLQQSEERLVQGTLVPVRPQDVAPGAATNVYFEVVTDQGLGPLEWFAVEL